MTKSETCIKLKNVPKRDAGEKETLVMDPIHGFIDISEYPVIRELIRTPFFQRLRRLYQLGLTSDVYPNATHSRFAHCLGVMSVFLTLFDSVTRRSKISKNRIEQMRPVGAVAALLHDLGHGPFSHASENILENGKFDHEKMTRKIILETEIRKILKKNNIEPQLICDILSKETTGDMKIISQLVSSQLDADRIDYLIRDSYFSGVNYGKIDIHRIANTLKIWEKNGPFKWTVIISPKGLSAVEDYILGRYLMYRGVYFHKVTRCMERLLINVFKRAVEIKDKELKNIINTTQPVTPKNLLKVDDFVCYDLFHKWAKLKRDKILNDLSKRILNRNLLSSYQITSGKYVEGGIDSLTKLKKIFKGSGFNSDYYLIEDKIGRSAYDIYSIAKIDDKYSPISHIMLPDENGKLVEISHESSFISTLSSDPKIKVISFFFPKEVLQKVKSILDN